MAEDRRDRGARPRAGQGSGRTGGTGGTGGTGSAGTGRTGRTAGTGRTGGTGGTGRGKPEERRARRGGREERRGTGDRREGSGRRGGDRDADQARYDGPEIPAEITGAELDRNVAAQLRGLPEKLAARVARHLVAAGLLLHTDPETAYQHTLAARARASRVALIREATGEAAYAAGHYAEALAELRAAKRMNGAIDYLPVMADCERALGRPERALELARSAAVAKLSQAQQVEMTIVEAGARHDLGETTSALRTLENAPLRSASREEWVVRLRYAYADLLAQAGRTDEAIEWFHRTAAIDAAQTTDATDRLTTLEHPTHN